MLQFNKLLTQLPDRISSLGPQGFVANVMKLYLGNLAAQVLSVFAYPILTRIYTPADMGVLAFVASATVILFPLAGLHYEMALPLAKSEEEAKDILVVCFVALTATIAVIALTLWLLPRFFLDRFGAVAPYRLFIPLALFATASYAILCYEATRQGRFAEMGRTRIYQALNGPIVQIGLGGIFHAGTIGLLIGFVIGQSAGVVGLFRLLLSGRRSALRNVNAGSIWATAVRYKRFPIFSSWSGVFSAAAPNFMTLAFPLLYGAKVGGFLFLAERILVRPLGLLTGSILHVFIMEVGRTAATAPENMRNLFLDITVKQFGISALWISAIVLSAPYFVPFIFGDQWAAAPIYLRYLAIGFFPGSIVTTVLYTLQALGKQKLAAAIDVCRTSSIIITLVIAYKFGLGAMDAVLACSLAQAAAQVAVFAVMYREVDRASARAQHADDHVAPR
jgi:O-antigen/teichoic acid export membrane protein